MTVRSGAAGNERVVLNSNICSSSTMKMKIWCCEYLRSMEMDTVCRQSKVQFQGGWMDGWLPAACNLPNGIGMHFCKVQQTRRGRSSNIYLLYSKSTHEDHHDQRCSEVTRPRRQPADEVVVRSRHGVPRGVVKSEGIFNPIQSNQTDWHVWMK